MQKIQVGGAPETGALAGIVEVERVKVVPEPEDEDDEEPVRLAPSELTGRVRLDVLDRYRYWDVEDGNWYEEITERFNQGLERRGYATPKPTWDDLGLSGVVAASFESGVEGYRWIKRHGKTALFPRLMEVEDENELWIDIENRSSWGRSTCHMRGMNYYYEACPDAEGDPAMEAELDRLIQMVQEESERRLTRYYRQLSEEYEWLTSDETVIERLEANDYYFNEYGEEVD